MKASIKLRYISMAAFIIGYVGMSLYIDPILMLFIALTTLGFTTTVDVIRIEEVEKELEQNIKSLEQINKALVELRELAIEKAK